MLMAEPFAETLQPRGERGLVGWGYVLISLFARVVGHAFDTRSGFGEIATVPPSLKPRGTY
jgi:hypothetical protein